MPQKNVTEANRTEIVGVRFTKRQLDEFDRMVADGIYANRSEAIRDSCLQGILKYRGAFTGKTKPLDKALKDKIWKEYCEEKGYKLD
ncbi:MAG: ribbon-helix-helix domain-containing protein [archaeon]